MVGFKKRLREVKDAAGFTIKDLAAWLDGIPWQTVSTWLNGREPKGYRCERVYKALTYLERELRRKRGSSFPIPLGVKEGARHAYVREARAKYPNA